MKDITALFNRFAGKEVSPPRDLATDLTAMPDRVISEIKQLANANGLTTRIFYPGVNGTQELRTDRLNVYIKKKGGKYHIANFSIG